MHEIAIVFEDVKSINDKTLKSMLAHLKPRMAILGVKMTRVIKQSFAKTIFEGDAVQSLIKGRLRAEFGFRDGMQRMESIVQTWIDNVMVTFNSPKLVSGQIVGGFKIELMRSDFQDVLSNKQAMFVTPEHGHQLDWLDWLLTYGAKVIIRNYDFDAGAGKGRSHHGRMVQGFGRRFWNVPAEFQGIAHRNFATHAIDQLHQQLPTIFAREMKRVF